MIKRLFHYIHNVLTRATRRRPQDGLTAVEYEAVCLISYEGRAAYARSRQQAVYYRARGSEQGFRFWSDVAAEVERRAGASANRTQDNYEASEMLSHKLTWLPWRELPTVIILG
jgi:hypothetical protein